MDITKMAALVLAGSLTIGCGVINPIIRSEKNLSKLTLNDERLEVIKKIGAPDAVRGARKLEGGSTFQIDEYKLYEKGTPLKNALWGNAAYYWIQYADGRLDKWGRAGDWNADITQDITIRQK